MAVRWLRWCVGLMILGGGTSSGGAQEVCPLAAPSASISLTRSVPSDRTRDDIRRLLMDQGRVAVVEQVGGVSVRGVTVRQREERGVGAAAELTDLFLEQFRQEVGGRIVQECARFTDLGIDSIRMDLSAIVSVESEQPAPGFVGEVRLSRDAYREGEEVKVFVTTRLAARVFLFAVARDGSATLFFPHRYDKENQLPGGATLELPRRGSPYQLVVTADARYGFPQAEYVLAVFYQGEGESPFLSEDAFVRTYSFTELNRELLRMPRRSRTEAAAAYVITGRPIAR